MAKKKKEPKYFTPEVIADMANVRDLIYAERAKIWNKYAIDILDTDCLSSLQVYDVVKVYDSDFNVNFARNGEDGTSRGVLIEQKTSKIDKSSQKTSFMFHAMGDLFSDRYIFAVRSKKNLELIRLYDIDKKENIEKVQAELQRLKSEYLAKGFRKFDGIHISEDFLMAQVVFRESSVINSCVVYRDTL